MKIIFINSFYYPNIGGGAEIILQSLVEGIKGLGHEVVVITTADTPGVSEDLVNGVRVLRVCIANVYWQYNNQRQPASKRAIWHLLDIYNPTMGNLIKEIVRREQPDIINCHNLAGFSASVWHVIQQCGVPIVQVLHDMYHLCPKSTMFSNGHACPRQCLNCKAFRIFTPFLSSKIKTVIGVSQFILDKNLVLGLFKQAKIKIAIHNARAISQQAPPEKKDGGNIRFGFIGTLAPSKGIELLLDAFANSGLHNAELWIAGKGYQEYELKLKQKATSNVHFLGYSKPEEFFPNIDVLVVPSIWQEPLGMVVLEAFSFGVPVIGSRRGGIPEMIQEGVNGFLFEPNNGDELAILIKRILGNSDEIDRMRPLTQTSALSYLDVTGWVKKYEAIFQRTI